MDFLDISSIDASRSSINMSVENRRHQTIIISISIGNGKTEEITILDHETPKSIARDFCVKHNLNPEAEKVIISVIKEHLKPNPEVQTSHIGEVEVMPYPTEKNTVKREPQRRGSVNCSLMSQTSMARNTGERLYNEGIVHKEKYEKKISDLRDKLEKEQMKESTFKPNISNDRKMEKLTLLGNEGHIKNSLDRCQILFDRSKMPNKTLEKPLVSSNFSNTLNKSRKHLQHYLDQNEQKKKPVLRHSNSNLRQRIRRPTRSQSTEKKFKLSSEQTDKIMNRIKIIRFMQIFENLNPNEKQEINKGTIANTKLSKAILRVLKPFLDELRSLNLSLNLEHFCRIMELYLKDLTPEDRNVLLKTGRKRNSLSCSNGTLRKDLISDLWSPKYETKLLVFDNLPECT